MTIIINLFGIIIGLISLFFVATLGGFFPSLVQENFGVAMLVSMSVLSLVSEMFGLKARVFIYIPVWLLGILYGGQELRARWGVWGIVVAVACAIALLYAFHLLAKAMEKRAWRAAQKRAHGNNLSGMNPATPEFWKTVGSLFFVPRLIPNDKTICLHNQQVLKPLTQLQCGFTDEERKALSDLLTEVEKGAGSDQPAKIPAPLYDTVEKLISVRRKGKPKSMPVPAPPVLKPDTDRQ